MLTSSRQLQLCTASRDETQTCCRCPETRLAIRCDPGVSEPERSVSASQWLRSGFTSRLVHVAGDVGRSSIDDRCLAPVLTLKFPCGNSPIWYTQTCLKYQTHKHIHTLCVFRKSHRASPDDDDAMLLNCEAETYGKTCVTCFCVVGPYGVQACMYKVFGRNERSSFISITVNNHYLCSVIKCGNTSIRKKET